MPARGYRKGVTDPGVPLAVFARTRLPAGLHQQLADDARRRRMTLSKLLRAILEHHYRNRPLPRVKTNGPLHEVTCELNRIGVNLNQLAHLAHVTRLVPVPELTHLLARIEATIDRL